jgi:hypothetical protein
MPESRPSSALPWPEGHPSAQSIRQSRGLEQFLATLAAHSGCAVLDLGGANQANIDYVTNLGHRISSENFLEILDSVWSNPEVPESRKIEEFLEQALDCQADAFAGALLWDHLQYLPPALLEAVVSRMYHLVRPGALLLTFFHADEKIRHVPCYEYRILDSRNLQITPRGLRERVQFFNNRALEKLFQSYASVKFFLTRDHLREVLVRR